MNIIQFILRILFIEIPYEYKFNGTIHKDSYFNPWNPLTYVFMLIVVIISGMDSGIKQVKEDYKDYRKILKTDA